MANNRKDSKGRVLPPGITERKDGRYMGRVMINGKNHTLYNRNLAALKKEMVQLQANIQNGGFIQAEKVTLNEWFEKWLDIYKKSKLKPLTLSNYKKYWERYVEKEIGKMYIGNIKRIHIIQHYNNLIGREKNPISYGTLQYVNNLVYGAMEQAFQNDMIPKNPCSSVLKEINKTPPKAKTALTVDQQKAFFDFIKDHKVYNIYYPLFLVAFGTGLRIGELLSLTWKDIDYKNNQISVEKTIHYAKVEERQEFSITKPKTQNSIRTIPMLDGVRAVLRKQREYQLQLGIDRRYTVDGYKDFCFTTKNGTTFSPVSINREIKWIVEKYNAQEEEKAKKEDRESVLLPMFTAHIMRHTFCTRLCESGMNIKAIQDIMGHADIKTTMNIYSHATDQMKQDAMKAIENRGII